MKILQSRPSRRTFLAALLGAPLAALGQPDRAFRIGYLSVGSPQLWTEAYYETFKQRLAELGYVDGRNVRLIPRWSETNAARLPALAAELVALQPAVIVAATTPAVAAVARATSSIPVVMSPASDPVRSGFVETLSRPGRNITGVSSKAIALGEKTVELARRTIPSATRLAVLLSDNPSHVDTLQEIRRTAGRFGIGVVAGTARSADELEPAFAALATQRAEILIVLAEAMFLFQRGTIAQLAARLRLPAIYQAREHVEAGGLMSYGASVPQFFRRAAEYVDRILKGARPSDLPVQEPTEFELVLNRRAASQLGITFPYDVLLGANRIVEVGNDGL
jgi:putative ABC transport system substrate-binding protein